MSWRIVVVSKNCKLDYKMGFLVVRSIDQLLKIHLSEIAVLLIESTAVSLTSYLLCELINQKVKVIFCDHKRMPLSELLNLQGSYDSFEKITTQFHWSEEIKNSAWKQIIERKILNQSLVLNSLGFTEESTFLAEQSKEIEWMDQTNREGAAAKLYFSTLFGNNFSRQAPSIVNAALNYAYAVVLSAVTREISIAGYLPQLGIAHHNKFNSFNFSCDLIEPLRPIIDHWVITLAPQELNSREKHKLVEILEAEVSFDERKHHFLSALRLYVQSVLRVLNSIDNDIEFIHYEF